MDTFKTGQKTNYGIGSDTYPCEVVRVSPSGKTVEVEELTYDLKKTGERHTFRANKVGQFRSTDSRILRNGAPIYRMDLDR